MNAQREHSRTGALVMILGLAVAVPACAREREPTGPSDADAAEAAGPSGAVYPEERRAVELSETVPDLAGFYYDTAGNVIVALKDGEQSDAIRHALRPRFARELIRARGRNPGADVLVRRAQYSFLELKAWRDRLMAEDVLAHPGVVWLDLDEVKNRVVIGLDGGDPITLLGVPPDVVEFEATGPYVVQQTLQSELRPILGGIQIQRVSGSQRVSCTLGFNALWNDQQVFLTAGHCSPNQTGTDGVEQFQPVAPLTAGDSSTITAVGREIFHHSEPCGNRRCSYSDAAIYEVLADTIPPIPDQQWRLGYIAKTVSGCFRDCPEPILDLDPNRPYWIIDTTHQSFVVNDLVSKMGSATGWSQALVQRTCVNVSPSQGVTLNCQMFADYGADDGDSGAPILLDIGCCTDSTVTLGGMHSGRAGSNSVFSPWSGIVQDYGSLSVVFVQQDTTRPPVPATPNLPDDSTLTVVSPWGGDVRYHRNIVVIAFDDSTSGLTVRRVLAKYKGAIIGGSEVREEPAYYVRIPDPGTTFAAIDSVTSLIEAEPGVKWAYIPTWRGLIRIRSRYPQDGPQSTRRDWFSPTDGTRARLAIRAPLAWGCETGTYGARPKLGVIDWVFNVHTDLQVAETVVPSATRFEQLTIERLEHGNKVAGIAAATGDNGEGIAGMVWGSELHLYALGTQIFSAQDPVEEYRKALDKSRRAGVRVLSSSVSVGQPGDSRVVKRLQAAVEKYLNSDNVFVYALPNNRQRVTVAQVRETQDTLFTALDRAVAGARERLANRIIAVAGTGVDGGLLRMSDYWTGGTDVLAPGEDILTLAHSSNGTTVADSGNSFAAPFVAGTTALLMAMDPTLSAAQVKDFIVRGAQLPRGNPVTGQEDPAQPVAGAPETVYQLDAYGALQLAARRQGAPLCRNRVWAEGTRVIAERDPSPQARTTEQLAALGEPGILLNVRHGGRRFDVSNGVSDRAFELRQGAWVETSDTATTPHGGTFLSLFGRSHDLDSAAIVEWQAVNDSEVVVRLDIRDFPAGTLTTLKTLVFPTARYPTTACVTLYDGACAGTAPTGTDEDVERIELAYPSLGGRLLLAVTYFTKRDVGFTPWQGCEPNPPHYNSCAFREVNYQGQTDRTVLWAVDLRTRVDTLLSELPGVGVFWFGVSEEGAERVSGEGVTTAAGTGTSGEVFITGVTGCAVRYRGMAGGAEVRPAILTADACATLRRGQGTIAPAPPVVGSP